MSEKERLFALVDNVNVFARSSKLYRLSKNPLRYFSALFFSRVLYPFTKRGWRVNTNTFWNDKMTLLLPSSMDIFLCGGKTHDSEIRLCKYLINEIDPGDHVMDIGAHIGFFSLLSSLLVKDGKVLSIEASTQTFILLAENTRTKKNILIKNVAVSNTNGILEFLEFPILFSEYNTMEKDIYANENWFKKVRPEIIKVASVTANDLLVQTKTVPKIIKIDVEGGEEKAVEGLLPFLVNYSPQIVMEFANHKRNNKNHIRAESLLRQTGYLPYRISENGKTETIIGSTSDYITLLNAESDNIVYKRIATKNL